MARYGGEIENGDFNKGKEANVGLFLIYQGHATRKF